MSVNISYLEEYTERIKERYSSDELLEILGVDIDTLIEIFLDDIIENKLLQEELGINKYE